MQIVWKDIPGYEGIYQASNMGQIKALARTWVSGRGHRIVKSKPETIISQRKTELGYLHLMLTKNGKTRDWRAHVLVALTFIPNPENKPEVNHKQGNKLDNRVSELEWVTSSENKIHAFRMGLCVTPEVLKGSKSPAAKLTEDQAKIIKMSPLSTRKLAKEYGVHHSIIGGIKSGKRWAHIAAL